MGSNSEAASWTSASFLPDKAILPSPRPSTESGAEAGRPSSKREVASAGRGVAALREPRDRGLSAPLIGRIRPATYSVAGRTTKNRRRPTLPGGCPPSTIGAERLNCSVRNGKRCLPLAMHHRNFARQPRWSLKTAQDRKVFKNIRQALDPLVPVGYVHYCASTAGLSTWWSTRGLTPSRGWESSS